eukprot:m.311174 g.311174  ORF g.311174 m.311174 type:complete len:52 (+) comp61255_c0_seq1:789-944(+)
MTTQPCIIAHVKTILTDFVVLMGVHYTVFIIDGAATIVSFSYYKKIDFLHD